MTETTHTLVIGGGQAGIATSAHLQKQGVSRLDVVNYIAHGISKVQPAKAVPDRSRVVARPDTGVAGLQMAGRAGMARMVNGVRTNRVKEPSTPAEPVGRWWKWLAPPCYSAGHDSRYPRLRPSYHRH